MPKPVPAPKNKAKVAAKESAARQPTLFSHFKSKERALSIENDESTKRQTPASQGVTSDAQKTVIDTLQPPSTGVGELSQSEPEDGGPLVISTPTSEVLGLPPSSPLSVAPSPTTTLSSPDIEIVAVDAPPLLPLPKTLHPFFSRPSKGKQSSPEIIIVAESSPPPEVVKDAKTTNDSSQKKTLGPPRARGLRRGHSYECPIVVDSSPVKATPSSQPSLRVSQKPNNPVPKQIHPLFQLRAARARSGSPLVLDRATPLLAPFPDSESQHVKGPQQDITVAKHSLGFHSKKSIDEVCVQMESLGIKLDNDASIEDRGAFTPISCEEEARLEYLSSIPKAQCRTHPSIGRIVSALRQGLELRKAKESQPTLLWSDRWRPTRADEVLGNEQSALYLRDWLVALQLQVTSAVPKPVAAPLPSNSLKRQKSGGTRGTKRPRVVRSVDKKGRKKRRVESDEDDDWVVPDDFAEPEIPLEDEEEDEALHTGRLHRKDSSEDLDPIAQTQPIYSFKDYLSNTILLAGPPGVGKTAAVYACAEELGWDVFEVYPGIGKRGGANLDNLIGEVGKNHHVGKTWRRNGDSTTTGVPEEGPFGKQNGKSKKEDTVSQSVGTSSNNFGFLTEPTDESSSESSHVRQSIVLLEEVDILFKDDANFWLAVTNFIRDCKRPVICTCNDLSLVPIHDLPLQATLEFSYPATDVAASYLQAISCAEGSLVERQRLSRLYESIYSIDEVDVPETKVTGVPSIFPHPDIRRAINTLQLWLAGNGNPGRAASKVRWQENDESVEDLLLSGGAEEVAEGAAEAGSGRTPFHAEFLSFADSHLLRDPRDSAQALWHGTTEVSQDDEVGHMVLVRPSRALSVHDGLGMYDRDTLIAEDAIRRARGLLGRKTIVDQGMFRPRELFRARVEYHSQVVAVLGQVVPEAILGRPLALHADYGPWVRAMVAADDAQEALAVSQSRGGRMTRNSLGYVRSVALGPRERDSLAKTGLEVI